MITFTCPVKNATLTSPFGNRMHPTLYINKFHYGVDLVSKDGANVPILATANGKVRLVKTTKDGYGKYIIINHNIKGKTYESLYAHLSSYNVKVGQEIIQGQQIGIMGKTGIGTGVHLHFEIHEGTYKYANGTYPTARDPMKYISLTNKKESDEVNIDLSKITINDMSNKSLKENSIAMVEQALNNKYINNKDWLKQAKDGTLSIADLIGLKITIDSVKK